MIKDSVYYAVVYSSEEQMDDEWDILNNASVISDRIPNPMTKPLEVAVPKGHHYVYLVRFAHDGSVVLWTTFYTASRYETVVVMEACNLGEVSFDQ